MATGLPDTTPLPSAYRFAAAIAVVAGIGLLAALVVGVGGRVGAPERPVPHLATPEVADLPRTDDFPVRVAGRELRGAYLKGAGTAFVVVDQLRCDRVGGAPPPPAGHDLFGVRVGVATDSAEAVDPGQFSFSLVDTRNTTYEPVAVTAPGRIPPGPRTSYVEAYFALPFDARPSTLLISARGKTTLRMPACPVPAPGDGESAPTAG